jgi:hypothetical protein
VVIAQSSDGICELFLNERVLEPGSALAIVSQGLGILKAEGGRETFAEDTGFDRFTNAWFNQSPQTGSIDYYNCKQPKTNSDDNPSIYYKAEPDFFMFRQ